jgi:hypothetical protein
MAACSALSGDRTPARVPAELQSGFLTDYDDLVVGEQGRASFVYRAPELDITRYKKVLLDHVTLWRESDRGFGDIPDADLDRLAVRLFTDLYEALDEDYEMVSEPGPGVMRVAVAITDVGHANAPMDIYNADVDAKDRVEHEAGALGDPIRGFLVNASLEVELTDAVTRRVLAAALDRRLAERVQDGRFDSWTDVEWGFDAWARLLATRLHEARHASATRPRHRGPA